eukprot:m.126798 g.126798  ORF g.126798 m.126798 type:complete len:519 (+) comp29220_c1_seq3:83-1639(+)
MDCWRSWTCLFVTLTLGSGRADAEFLCQDGGGVRGGITSDDCAVDATLLRETSGFDVECHIFKNVSFVSTRTVSEESMVLFATNLSNFVKHNTSFYSSGSDCTCVVSLDCPIAVQYLNIAVDPKRSPLTTTHTPTVTTSRPPTTAPTPLRSDPCAVLTCSKDCVGETKTSNSSDVSVVRCGWDSSVTPMRCRSGLVTSTADTLALYEATPNACGAYTSVSSTTTNATTSSQWSSESIIPLVVAVSCAVLVLGATVLLWKWNRAQLRKFKDLGLKLSGRREDHDLDVLINPTNQRNIEHDSDDDGVGGRGRGGYNRGGGGGLGIGTGTATSRLNQLPPTPTQNYDVFLHVKGKENANSYIDTPAISTPSPYVNVANVTTTSSTNLPSNTKGKPPIPHFDSSSTINTNTNNSTTVLIVNPDYKEESEDGANTTTTATIAINSNTSPYYSTPDYSAHSDSNSNYAIGSLDDGLTPMYSNVMNSATPLPIIPLQSLSGDYEPLTAQGRPYPKLDDELYVAED